MFPVSSRNADHTLLFNFYYPEATIATHGKRTAEVSQEQQR